MRLLADESVDFGIVSFLEEEGFSIGAITKTHSGVSDDVVLALALEQDAVLITEDKDFGELTVRMSKPNRGIILFRAEPMALRERCQLLKEVLDRYGVELKECLTVIDSNGRVRLRRIGKPK